MPLSCEKPVLAVAFLCFLAVSKTVTAFGIHPGTLETRFGNTRHAIPSKSRLHLFDLFNAGKKALVRQLAGEYDQVAVRTSYYR